MEPGGKEFMYLGIRMDRIGLCVMKKCHITFSLYLEEDTFDNYFFLTILIIKF